MLDDFIKVNTLKARLFKGFPKENLIKCRLYLADGGPVLAIAMIKGTIDSAKIKSALSAAEVLIPSQKEVEKITGYKEEDLPPISVYGVIALIDEKVMRNETVFMRLGEGNALEIPTKEIEESNEEVKIAEIC